MDVWLTRNYLADLSAFHGPELVSVYDSVEDALGGGIPRERPRSAAALLLTEPHRWRPNSEMSFFFNPLTIPERDDGEASSAAATSGAADSTAVATASPSPATSRGGQLAVVDYAAAVRYVVANGKDWVVLPLFRQARRPAGGTDLAVPLQFASEAVTGGSGGADYEPSHIAVAYFTALQFIIHKMMFARAESLPDYLRIVSFLLADLAAYADAIAPVAAVVEQLRATTTAQDMTQYMLSMIVSRVPFTTEEVSPSHDDEEALAA